LPSKEAKDLSYHNKKNEIKNHQNLFVQYSTVHYYRSICKAFSRQALWQGHGSNETTGARNFPNTRPEKKEVSWSVDCILEE